MAETSPMCSIMVAKASGMMVITAVISRPVSQPLANSPKTVLSKATGRPTHAALPIPSRAETLTS